MRNFLKILLALVCITAILEFHRPWMLPWLAMHAIGADKHAYQTHSRKNILRPFLKRDSRPGYVRIRVTLFYCCA